MKFKVLVTGGKGQLAQSIRSISQNKIDFVFKSSDELDITDSEKLKEVFASDRYDWCINCAAYTWVDGAESAKESAFRVNAEGAKLIAQVCRNFSVKLIHISTDFVFRGDQNIPYKETSETNPLSVYGASKLKGEQYIQEILKQHIIIRTSWLYSPYGKNFVKTMLELAQSKKEIEVVKDQFGSPTYALDLAVGIVKIILHQGVYEYGLFHFSNLGCTSWYGLAKQVYDFKLIDVTVHPILSSAYKTKANRPHFSALNSNKIGECYDIYPEDWKTALKKALINL